MAPIIEKVRVERLLEAGWHSCNYDDISFVLDLVTADDTKIKRCNYGNGTFLWVYYIFGLYGVFKMKDDEGNTTLLLCWKWKNYVLDKKGKIILKPVDWDKKLSI